MSIGCLMLDLEGFTVSPEEKEKLQHPLTGGVILFARNFQNQQQIEELCRTIRSAAAKPILIAVDQEGGRVQRFHQEFTRIPAMGIFKTLNFPELKILEMLTETGWIMAAELLASGIDISFAPVLDVDVSISKVIGDRGFSEQPQQIIDYASALIQGMKKAGMAATGKHFPGHGSTVSDSHFESPVDHREMQQIRKHDLRVFVAICQSGIGAIMPSHVIYPEVDHLPACFSHYWLQTILRNEIGFEGVIFSDDLSMAAAKSMGDILSRAKQALSAGCDMILCCNEPSAAVLLLDQLPQQKNTDKTARIKSMFAVQNHPKFEQLKRLKSWTRINRMLLELEKN